MKVILTQRVPYLGEKGGEFEVANGYANNYLFPRGLAIVSNPSNRKSVAEEQRQTLHKNADLKAKALLLAERIEQLELLFTRKLANKKESKIHGSIAAADVVKQLATHNIVVQEQQVVLRQPLKQLGGYEVVIALHKDISPKLKLVVKGEE